MPLINLANRNSQNTCDVLETRPPSPFTVREPSKTVRRPCRSASEPQKQPPIIIPVDKKKEKTKVKVELRSCSPHSYKVKKISHPYLLTNENNGIEPALVHRGHVKVFLCRGQHEGYRENLNGITGHGPTTEKQDQPMKSPVPCRQNIISAMCGQEVINTLLTSCKTNIWKTQKENNFYIFHMPQLNQSKFLEIKLYCT